MALDMVQDGREVRRSTLAKSWAGCQKPDGGRGRERNELVCVRLNHKLPRTDDIHLARACTSFPGGLGLRRLLRRYQGRSYESGARRMESSSHDPHVEVLHCQ